MKAKVVFGSGGNMFPRDLFDYLRELVANIPYVAIPVVIAMVFLIGFWHLLQKFTTAWSTTSTSAYTLQRGGILLGQAVGMLHIFTYSVRDDGLMAVVWMLLEAVWVCVALAAARPVVDMVVLRKIPNMAELLKGNKPVGVVEGGFYFCVGIAVNGSLDGRADSWIESILSTVVFGPSGFLLIIGVFLVHVLVVRRQMRDPNEKDKSKNEEGNSEHEKDKSEQYSLHRAIAAGDMTAAYEVAGMLVGVSLVMREAIAGDFSGWGPGFVGLIAAGMVVVGLFYVARAVFDRLVLTNCTVKSILAEKQINAGALMMALLVVTGLLVSTGIRLQL